MANTVRRIGLSLGADICWPICYEEILRAAKVNVPVGDDRVSVECERVAIRPFALDQPSRFDVVIDRLTHWFHTSREWIKKAIILDDVYVFNNPWSLQSMEKHTSYCAMLRLGMPIPPTWLIPPKDYEPSTDLRSTLTQYAKLFDLGEVGEKMGYPIFMKPYDGGAWVGVSKIDDDGALRAAYEQSGKKLMHLQKAVLPHDLFVRTIGLGPQVRSVRYDPGAPLHDRYRSDLELGPEDLSLLADITLTINAFFGWDFNSCETLRQDGTWYPIDFANPCPDSQVTSTHFHFPWIVLSNIRWSVFCAVTQRKMRQCLDWEPFYAVADRDLPYRERIAEYAKIARERLDSERFEEFCASHLGHLDEVAYEFFGSDRAREAVRLKVQALFPEHEIEEFTELFWGRIQEWRSDLHDTVLKGAGVMHVLFVEPGFPSNQGRFVEALSAVGARVTGIGEAPLEALPGTVRHCLHRYERVRSVVHEASVLDAVRRCQAREWVDRLEATIEAHILPVARVREACGIPGTSVQTAYLCRDKPAMKEALRDSGIPCARSTGAVTSEAIRAFVTEVGLPIVIKPPDAAGAAGVEKVSEPSELEGAIARSGVDQGVVVAVEEFNEGHEGFYDTISIGGRVVHEFASHYYPNVLEAMRTRWISPQIIVTNRIEAQSYDEVRQMAQKVITALEIGTSPTHMEWFFGPKGLRFSEIGCRPPGVGAWDLYCAANDMDLYREWAHAIVHERPSQRPSRRYSAGMIALRPDRDGRIMGVEGLRTVHEQYGEWIIDEHIPRAGTSTQPVEGGYWANAWMRLKHPDYDTLKEILDDVGRMTQVRAQ